MSVCILSTLCCRPRISSLVSRVRWGCRSIRCSCSKRASTSSTRAFSASLSWEIWASHNCAWSAAFDASVSRASRTAKSRAEVGLRPAGKPGPAQHATQPVQPA
eukprot:5910624-Pyramimonas_sp.AAC.1